MTHTAYTAYNVSVDERGFIFRGYGIYPGNGGCGAEVERLRAALEEIADNNGTPLDGWPWHVTRAALDEK